MPKATVTTVQEVTIAPKVVKKLLTELHGYASITGEMKALKDAKEEHSSEVLKLAIEGVDGDKFELEGYKVAVMRGVPDRRLDKDKLVKRLVKDGKYTLKAAMAILNDSTSEKPKKDHVRITIPGEETE